MNYFVIVHKLTNKPIRSHQTNEVIIFDSKDQASNVCEMKNEIIGADFYKVMEINEVHHE